MEELLQRGGSAQRDGDYVSAVVDFENALRARPGAEEVVEAAFTALRQVAVSQSLIDKFLDEFGWSSGEYRGFDHLESELSREAVRRRLGVVVRSVPEDSSLGIRMQVDLEEDRFCEGGELNDGVTGGSNSKVQSCDQILFLSGLNAMQQGKLDVAAACLSSAIAENPVCGSAYLLLGRIYYRRGEGALALANMNLALSHPEGRWLGAAFGVTGPVVLGRYKEYRLVAYKSEFYAVPDSKEFFFSAVKGIVALYEHRVPSRVRARLQRVLPPAVVAILRRLIYSTPLRRELLKPVSLTRFLHGKDLRTVIHAVDERLADWNAPAPGVLVRR